MGINVGRIVRSSTTRFAVGCQVLKEEVPVFGSLVKVPAMGQDEVYGLIYDVRMEDDPFVRQMASAADDLGPEYIEDMRRNRQVPIEVAILVVGYQHKGVVYQRLPPQPPLSLDVICTCTGEELVRFTEGFDYFWLVLDHADVPGDELLAANLRYAAAARVEGNREIEVDEDFLVEAGRELARLLAMNLTRLDAILRRIRP